MSEQVRCTKDCWLYDRAESCIIRKRKPNGTYVKVHREYCDCPRPGDYKDKDFDVFTMMDDSEYHPQGKHKRTMPNLMLCKNKVPHNNVKKPLMQLTDDGKVVATYQSINDAACAMGGTCSNISKAACGYSVHAYGYRWKFIETNN